jgi:bifunctional DNA-binding transcriptional regulator/antitoxin component of YhaV-PrlF toxin-antitoxin module
MGGTHAVTMGDRGRLVVPAEVRERYGFDPGVPLVLVETAAGLVVTTRESARELVRQQLRGPSLVEELIADRRRDAAEDER